MRRCLECNIALLEDEIILCNLCREFPPEDPADGYPIDPDEIAEETEDDLSDLPEDDY